MSQAQSRLPGFDNQHAWDTDSLNVNWSGLIAYAYPPSQVGPENSAMELRHHNNSPRLARDALVWGPSAALDGNPISTASVMTQIVPQPIVP